MLAMEPKTSCMLGRCSISGPYHQLSAFFIVSLSSGQSVGQRRGLLKEPEKEVIGSWCCLLLWVPVYPCGHQEHSGGGGIKVRPDERQENALLWTPQTMEQRVCDFCHSPPRLLHSPCRVGSQGLAASFVGCVVPFPVVCKVFCTLCTCGVPMCVVYVCVHIHV